MKKKNNSKFILKNFLIFLIIFLIISGVFSLINIKGVEPTQVGINYLIKEIEEEKIEEITIEEDKLNILLKNGKSQFSFKESNQSLISMLADLNVSPKKIAKISIKIKSLKGKNAFINIFLPLLFPLLIFVGIFYFFSRKLKGAGSQAFKFGKSNVRKINPKEKKIKTKFKDVAGIKEAKEELEEVVDFLKNPKKYIKLGAKIPKGVLLVGPPGCGKTLLSRAVAGESNVPFFHISGSEFIEMFVGVGASRVRDLFSNAKKSLPSIIFIDELDAVGRHRGAGLGGSHDEREQTLNQILVELDGFEANTGLIVIAATNRPDILDPALLRPGRFDRKIILDMPDILAREKILKIHSINKPLDKKVDLKKIAKRTPGFTGADLANLLNESAILSAKKNLKKISTKVILESIERVMLGPERKSHVLNKKEREIVAFHEAGHAITGYFLPGCDMVQKISLISRGRAAGYTLMMPDQEKSLKSRSEFMDQITSLLGGYMAEKKIFKEVTTGASNDLRESTKLVQRLVTEFGMSESLGPRTFGEKDELIFLGKEVSKKRNYSEKIAEKIDNEISMIIKTCQKKAKEILDEKEKELKQVAQTLLKKETLEKEEFEKIILKQ
ncbi:ATP-dependent zinc metalloprotease FtsH [Patescibacteria group bacterium]|nr:ATP-dependent zinc metalloprotease FtsH [Patescibacteria group bacterium]